MQLSNVVGVKHAHCTCCVHYLLKGRLPGQQQGMSTGLQWKQEELHRADQACQPGKRRRGDAQDDLLLMGQPLDAPEGPWWSVQEIARMELQQRGLPAVKLNTGANVADSGARGPHACL